MIDDGRSSDAVVRLSPPATAARAVAAPTVPAARLALVVDDEPLLVDVLTRILASIGWRSDGHFGASTAIRAYLGDPEAYALVLTDLRLGAESGLEVASAVREAGRTTPVVLLSGAPIPATLWETAADAGVLMVLYKPYRIHELIEVVRNYGESESPNAGPGPVRGLSESPGN